MIPASQHVHGDTATACIPMIPFDTIHESGSYVCNWNGYLLRVPPTALDVGSRPINLVGSEPLFVTKISDDPEVPVLRARQMAQKLNLRVSF